jgi:hypothetical protein
MGTALSSAMIQHWLGSFSSVTDAHRSSRPLTTPERVGLTDEEKPFAIRISQQ